MWLHLGMGPEKLGEKGNVFHGISLVPIGVSIGCGHYLFKNNKLLKSEFIGAVFQFETLRLTICILFP